MTLSILLKKKDHEKALEVLADEFNDLSLSQVLHLSVHTHASQQSLQIATMGLLPLVSLESNAAINQMPPTGALVSHLEGSHLVNLLGRSLLHPIPLRPSLIAGPSPSAPGYSRGTPAYAQASHLAAYC